MPNGRLIDRILRKRWTDADVKRYIGSFHNSYLTYARDENVRTIAASGGSTSALLLHGLDNNLFDGVIVCNTIVEDSKVRAQFTIATTADQILAARGSKYVETKFLHEVLPIARTFNGRLAVVGLPCDISALKRRCDKEPALANKITLTIALVCGHNSRTELIDGITKRLEMESGNILTKYRFRIGHWRGYLEAEFEDGSVLTKPSKFFNDYQNLFFFCERKCMACHDHYGYSADITVGDIWLFRLKNDPIKRTAIITRSDRGQRVFESSYKAGAINFSELDIRSIMDGQARIGPSHYNVSARHKAGKLLGIKLKDNVKQSVSWHSYLNALITLVNIRLSEKKWGKKLIFNTPRTILKVYLYFKKGLESL